MAFVHPLIGVLTIVLSVWVLTRGLTARQGSKAATMARRHHKRWAPVALGGMVLSGVSGLVSTWWIRPDLTLGETWHLGVGFACIATMGVAGLLTRAFTRNPALRQVHPWVGVLSVVLVLLQGLLGIQLLP